MALTTLIVSSVTMHDGSFLNAIGHVSVQDVADTLPTVTRPEYIVPVEVGEVPHDDTVGNVPVASQYPAPA
jgi:hypothetical protein